LVLDEVSGQPHAPAALTPRKRTYSHYVCIRYISECSLCTLISKCGYGMDLCVNAC